VNRLVVVLGLLAACGDNLVAPIDAPRPDGTGTDGATPVMGLIDGRCTGVAGKPRVLVYTYENQWRHISNYYARLAIYNMCVSRGFNVDTSNDATVLNKAQLANYDVVVFGITSGVGVPAALHPDLEAWVGAGGGVIGLHSADSTEETWDFYVKNIGAQFAGHVPGMQAATVRIVPENAHHPIVDGLTDFEHRRVVLLPVAARVIRGHADAARARRVHAARGLSSDVQAGLSPDRLGARAVRRSHVLHGDRAQS